MRSVAGNAVISLVPNPTAG